jgi:hypothetical protein
MPETLRLTDRQAASAARIQEQIDDLARRGGGEIVLPAVELELDRGLELRSGITLRGQGPDTLLRKGAGAVYPLSGYHNYGMRDVPLENTDGLEPGMTVAIRDDAHGGFYETLARIEWIVGNWVGLDTGLHSDYHAEQRPVLVTAFPLVFGRSVEHVAVRNLTLDGNRDAQPAGIGACRGAAVYFIRSRGFVVSEVTEQGFAGEGLGFQMCADGEISHCRFTNNTGNGYHPGAGSTGVLFEGCQAEENDKAGFFFCVRANHISVCDCAFDGNTVAGISVGTRDCYNLIDACSISGNAGPGILFRSAVEPVEVHSVRVRHCRIARNARRPDDVEGLSAQVAVLGEAHHLALEHNTIVGQGDAAGIHLAEAAHHIWLDDNEFDACAPAVSGGAREGGDDALAPEPLDIECGLDAVRREHYRHLGW